MHIIGFKVRIRFFEWRAADTVKGGDAVTVASCLPEQTGGKYVSTESMEELVRALQTTLGCPVMSRPSDQPEAVRRN